MFIFSYDLFSEFLLLVLFFSLGLVLQVWLSNFMLTLILFCMQLLQWATGVSFYSPLKFPQKKSKHLWLLFHFLFYSRFCISAPTPVTLAAIYFLKRERVIIFIYIVLSLFSFLIFIHLRHAKKSSKNSAKIIQPKSLLSLIFDWMKSSRK